MAAAVGDTLPFRARLSGGFAPSKQGPTRAAGDRAPDLSPDMRIALALLEKRATENPSPEALADLGLAQLIQGDIDRAISTIEDAASQGTNAAPWSDLSAAYLAKAERSPQRRVEYFARALEAAEKSLKIAKTNDALFNRALAREGLAPYSGAPAPWDEFKSAETDAAWREAAEHTATRRRPIDEAAGLWETRRKELVDRLKHHDASFIAETVSLYPEAAIEFLDRELLTDPNALREAELLATTIQTVTGDAMSRDEVTAVRNTGASLTLAHQLYAKGLSQFDASDFDGSRAQLARALDLFTRARAPYRAWAALWLAINDSKSGAFAASQDAMAAVEKDARRRHYTSLLARVLLQRGLIFNRQWRLSEGLAAFRESASLYAASAQHENAVSLYSNLADALRMLGEPMESWEYIGRTLEELPRLHKPLRRYLILYNAALFAGRQDLQESAALFQDAAVREASSDSRVLIEAIIHRALVSIRRGDVTGAIADLNHAEAQLQSTPAGPFRTYMTAELGIARAQLPNQQDTAGLADAIAFFRKVEPGRVPGLYLLLARAPRASRATTEDALRSGIENLESQQAGLGDDRFRISYFDDSWSLFGDMVALQVDSKNSAKAFEYAERSRARALLAASQGTAASRTHLLSEIQSRLPASMVMLHYTALADRILIWRISSDGATLVERPIAERELARAIEQQRAAIHDHRDDRAINDRLYALLIEPITASIGDGQTIALVPDAQLQQLSFATLRHPASGRYLIEDHPLVVSPSATFFVDARTAALERSGAIQSALLMGNPAAAGTRDLPGAQAEVEAAAKFYPKHDVFVGQTATKTRFVADASKVDVIHFGGHALVNPEFPLLSRLVFADDATGEQSLFAHEIASMRFPRTRVVFLAACSTAAGVASRGEGAVNIARPFLGGGVPLVIASQWDVDDRATEQLTLAFHRELAKSGNPVEALRTAQLSLLRSGDVMQARPESWGAFVAVGTTAQ